MLTMTVKINTKLLPVKACYFFFFGGVAPVLPFLPVYARQLGLSEAGVGAVYLALPIIAALARPLVGGIADATRRHKLVFLVLLVTTTLGYAALSQVPQLPDADRRLTADVRLVCAGESFISQCAGRRGQCHANRLHVALLARTDVVQCHVSCGDMWPQCGDQWCDGSAPLDVPLDLSAADKEGLCLFLPLRNVSVANGTVVRNPYCRTSNTVQCEISCSDVAVMKLLGGRPMDATSYYWTGQFWLFLFFLILAWVGTSLCVPLADTIAFKLLDEPSQYGYQRVWGSVGWGIFGFIAGYLVDRASAGRDEKDYTHAFYLLVGMLVLCLLVVTRLRVSALMLKAVRPQLGSGLRTLLVRPGVLLFLFSCCVVGCMTGVLWHLFFLYLEDIATAWDCAAYQWITTLSGGVLAVQCFAGEVPFFFVSGWLINKLGHVHTQTVVMLAFGVRFLLYSLLQNPWLVLPIELMNGLTFGLFYANMVGYAGVTAPPGMTATLQALVGAVFENVGVALGSGTGGLLYHAVGGARMFQVYGLVCLTAAAVYVLLQCVAARRCGDSRDAVPHHVADNMLQEMRPLNKETVNVPPVTDRQSPAPAEI